MKSPRKELEFRIALILAEFHMLYHMKSKIPASKYAKKIVDEFVKFLGKV